DPAMTLGCGGYGGNITSDNISPKHLLNIKRLAYELSSVAERPAAETSAAVATAESRIPVTASRRQPPAGIGAKELSRKIDDFLGSRGYHPDDSEPPASRSNSPSLRDLPTQPPLEFV